MRKILPVVAALFMCAASSAEIYVSISGANVKKAKIAVGKVHPLPDAAGGVDPELARKVREQVKSDLEFTGLFEFITDSLFQQFDQEKDLRSIRYEDWTSIQAAFVLKLGYKMAQGRLILEALFYDVAGQKKIFGTRYQYASNQYPRLVHALTEDVLKAITGEKGLFSSRIVMSCRDTKRRSSPPKDIFIVDPDGRNFKRLTSDETLSLSPSWSPDGKYITYTQYEFVRIGRIRKKMIVVKKHDLTNGQRKRLIAQDGVNSGSRWAPDGKKIALTMSAAGQPEVFLVDPNGEGEPEPLSRRIQWKKVGGDGFQATSQKLLFEVEPSFSPDGKKIVLSSRRTGHPMIYVVDLASMEATQLTFAGQYNASPSWSPRGDKIVFAAQRLAEGNFDLYLIDPDGNNLSRLTVGDRSGHRVNSENGTWAPTGRHLAFSANEGGTYGVYAMTVDGTVRRRVSPAGYECNNPSWGPAEN